MKAEQARLHTTAPTVFGGREMLADDPDSPAIGNFRRLCRSGLPSMIGARVHACARQGGRGCRPAPTSRAQPAQARMIWQR